MGMANSGSGWKEYKSHGTVHGITMPPNLQESQKLEKPLFTPSTKAEQGQHDENIHPDKRMYPPLLSTSQSMYIRLIRPRPDKFIPVLIFVISSLDFCNFPKWIHAISRFSATYLSRFLHAFSETAMIF